MSVPRQVYPSMTPSSFGDETRRGPTGEYASRAFDREREHAGPEHQMDTRRGPLGGYRTGPLDAGGQQMTPEPFDVRSGPMDEYGRRARFDGGEQETALEYLHPYGDDDVPGPSRRPYVAFSHPGDDVDVDGSRSTSRLHLAEYPDNERSLYADDRGKSAAPLAPDWSRHRSQQHLDPLVNERASSAQGYYDIITYYARPSLSTSSLHDIDGSSVMDATSSVFGGTTGLADRRNSAFSFSAETAHEGDAPSRLFSHSRQSSANELLLPRRPHPLSRTPSPPRGRPLPALQAEAGPSTSTVAMDARSRDPSAALTATSSDLTSATAFSMPSFGPPATDQSQDPSSFASSIAALRPDKLPTSSLSTFYLPGKFTGPHAVGERRHRGLFGDESLKNADAAERSAAVLGVGAGLTKRAAGRRAWMRGGEDGRVAGNDPRLGAGDYEDDDGVDPFRDGDGTLKGFGDADPSGKSRLGGGGGGATWGTTLSLLFGRRGANGERLRWNRFKWAIVTANAILTAYSATGLVACACVYLDVWTHSEVARAGNSLELALGTAAMAVALATSLVGWAGALLNNRAFLSVFALALWPSLALLVAPGYIAYKKRTFDLEGKTDQQWSKSFTLADRLTIQNALSCCGYFSPFVEAVASNQCYARSLLPGCKGKFFRFQKAALRRIYLASFCCVPANLFAIVVSVLCSNHITYRFGKGVVPPQYWLNARTAATLNSPYADHLLSHPPPPSSSPYAQLTPVKDHNHNHNHNHNHTPAPASASWRWADRSSAETVTALDAHSAAAAEVRNRAPAAPMERGRGV